MIPYFAIALFADLLLHQKDAGLVHFTLGQRQFVQQVEYTWIDTEPIFDMLLCMRTTIDMPDNLMTRAKRVMVERKITFRALVIDALEQVLQEKQKPFILKEAAAGYDAGGGARVSAEKINRAIDDMRDAESSS
ncbi:MAG: hypothetical protein KJ626_14590 [Verrucomicrobia bacterium]|nr:hypothetical protein [Verrucomicrobiota bacterium]